MLSKLENKLIFLAFVFIYLLFFFESFYSLDPDFGWHLKMGELILAKGIPTSDPFSYTMPSFPFVDHEWLTNVAIFFLYENIGYSGLAAIFSILSISPILIIFGKKQKKSLFTLPFILSSGALLGFIGIRPQVITWIFFSILVVFFLDAKKYEKFRFLLPYLFLVWANLHGGFAIGIFILALFIFIRTFLAKKIDILDLLAFAFSLLATLVNPYGIRLWEEVYMQMSDSTLRWSIQEWMPVFISFNMSLWMLFALSAIFFIRFRKSFGIFEKIFYLGLFAAGLSSIRHMAFWILFSVPILSKTLGFFRAEAGKIKYGKERFRKAYAFLIILALLTIIIPLLISSGIFSFSEKGFYPSKAIGYLKNHPGSGNLFSEYTWGGYLIWKYPEKKVFVDGRMPSWRWEREIKGESKYIFKEYRDLLSGKTRINDVAKKYNIDTVLFPAEVKKEKSFIGEFSERLEAKLNREEKRESIYSQLKKEGWKMVYKDDVAVVYRKR